MFQAGAAATDFANSDVPVPETVAVAVSAWLMPTTAETEALNVATPYPFVVTLVLPRCTLACGFVADPTVLAA